MINNVTGNNNPSRRRSFNPAMEKTMLSQLRDMFNRVSHADQGAERDQTGKTTSIVETRSIGHDSMTMISSEIEDDVRYLEASDSVEGPASQRMFSRISYRVCSSLITNNNNFICF